VDDRTKVLLATVAGAVAGALAGYLFLTEDGRRLRHRVEPQLDDLVAELSQVMRSVEKARTAADESWRTLQEAAGRTSARPPAR
jgi:gas vesicle protein